MTTRCECCGRYVADEDLITHDSTLGDGKYMYCPECDAHEAEPIYLINTYLRTHYEDIEDDMAERTSVYCNGEYMSLMDYMMYEYNRN